MPRRTVRTMHAEVAAAAYVRLRRFRAERLRKQRVLRRNPANGQPHAPGRKRKWTDSLSSLSSLGNLSSSDLSDDEVAIDGSADDSEFEQSDSDVLSSSTTSDSDFAYSDWSDILGLNWRTRRSARGRSFNAGNHSSASEAAGLSPDSAESPSDVAMESDAPPRLIPVALLSLSSVSSHSDSDTSDADSGADGDFSESGSSSSIDTMSDDLAPSTLGRRVRSAIEDLYTHRYTEPRTSMPRGPASLPHILSVLKHERPDQFRKHLRVTPLTFDKIIAQIIDDSVFSNNSQNAQLPIEHQLGIALYRFGHFGNGCSVGQVATWAGVGVGTVLLCTRRVMSAVLRKRFRDQAVRMPTEEEKVAAKEWVRKRACSAWRHGWCLVDGTLVPLFDRPFWFGESYFDRKCNYSLNIQIISLPNLRIIDYSYGFTGSTHDSTAFERTRMAQDHEDLLEPHEWIWADSAYPLETWLISPFKRPERDIAENHKFNNHVSMVRIRSEHAIGFLKGRFQSLKGMRVRIGDEVSHKFAGYWAAACINLHAFALQCEEEERNEAESDVGPENDDFVAQGLQGSDSSEDEGPSNRRTQRQPAARSRATQTRIAAAKAKREEIKEKLFEAKRRRRERRQAALFE